MAITTTTRMGVTRWSDGGDAFTRSQMDASHEAIEQRTMIYLQGNFSARPSAGTLGRMYYASDTQEMYYDDGTRWNQISSVSNSISPLLLMGV
jgi:hypothetical protein